MSLEVTCVYFLAIRRSTFFYKFTLSAMLNLSEIDVKKVLYHCKSRHGLIAQPSPAELLSLRSFEASILMQFIGWNDISIYET